MALPLRIDSAHVISVVFNRGHADFRNAERAVLDAIRRPLASIYRSHLACEAADVGLRCVSDLAMSNGWRMLHVSTAGVILDAPADALALLQRFFPDCYPPTMLPAPLAAWFARSRHWGLDRPALGPGERFTTSRLGARLTVHFVPDPLDAGAGFLLMKSERLELGAEQLSSLALTPREREILALVAGGKTNPEIGTALSISARTVQKHLEHIFQKFGVETRTAAAVCALAAADQHDAGTA
jgi:DNA-binding CsgD family transcriptional regulator